MAQVGVDAGEVEPIVERQQQEGHHDVADDEAETHLQIGHLGRLHHARNGNKGDTRNGGTHHAEGHHWPGRAAPGTIESLVGGTATGDAANHEQCHKIC